jgi:signal transduction histidine kinase
MASISRAGAGDFRELELALGRIDEATAGVGFPGGPRRSARARAELLYAASGNNHDAIPLAQLSYAGELLLLIAVDLAAEPIQAHRLIGRLEERAGVTRLALGREILQSGRFLGLPAGVAIEVRLAFLLAFTGASTVTLWTLAGQEMKLVAQAGRTPGERDAVRALARDLLADDNDSRPRSRAPLTGARLERLRQLPAALILEGTTLTPEQSELLMTTAGPALSALLDLQAPTGRYEPSQDTVLSSVQRRLARLRYDLHDGPQQDVHLLAQDLALFREQLRPMIIGDPNAGRLLGRLDDLEAQLVALDGDLRRLSTAVQSPLMIPGSLPEAVRAVTDAFANRTAVVPEVRFSGQLDDLTDSQQIALLSLIREALSNIRKHSEAAHVQITIAARGDGVRVEIRDDGNGFDPEDTLVAAARAGRLGLVGMHERVRMLGGVTEIDSHPGDGTVISATLPAWPGEDTLSPEFSAGTD